jgi:hypothetical protein
MSLITDFTNPSIVECYDYENKKSPDYESFIVEKKNGKLNFVSNGGFQTRNSSTIWCIEQADAIFSWPDFAKIKIVTNDGYAEDNEYSYSRTDTKYKNLVPDFNFRKWPEVGVEDYAEACNEIKLAGLKEYTINKVGWIGNTETNLNRVKLMELGQQYKEDLDIMSIDWHNKSGYISMPDLVKTYSMLLDIEGYGYSGRLKYLLFSSRPLLLVDRLHKEYFFEFLKPWTHYIPVNRDLSNLMEQVIWIKMNYSEALKIAKAAAEFADKYCTREYAFEQWNKIIQEI